MIVFRLPFSEKIYSVDEKSNGNFPIEFFGFNETQKIQFEGNLITMEREIDFNSEKLASDYTDKNELNESDYLSKIEEVISFIKENKLQKLVFSRKKVVDNFKKIDLYQSFKNLCESYPNAFVYLFQQKENCWIGAFSELLGKYNQKTEEFTTMSLAGTLPLQEEWTKKEIEEQKPVTEYIENILKTFNSEVIKSDTYSHISGKIKHLRTDFKINIKPEKVEQLIHSLHPTPAVCGIPKDFCREAISKFENHNRELYSGYSKITIGEEIYYFVNLRCAKIYQNRAYLYVGGGITKDSDAKKEWHETELKSHAILDNLVISN